VARKRRGPSDQNLGAMMREAMTQAFFVPRFAEEKRTREGGPHQRNEKAPGKEAGKGFRERKEDGGRSDQISGVKYIKGRARRYIAESCASKKTNQTFTCGAL